MLNTIKNFKWFFTISFVSILLGLLTFVTFINQKLIFLNFNNESSKMLLPATLMKGFGILCENLLLFPAANKITQKLIIYINLSYIYVKC